MNPIKRFPVKYDRIYNNFEPCKQYQKNIGVKYTPNGYNLLKLDHKLKKRLVDFWELNKNLKTPEHSIKEIKNTVKPDNQHITNLLILQNHDKILFDDLNKYIKKLLTKWTDKKMKHIATYGIREYTKGSMLECHIDRPTHVVSAIVNITGDKKWPLILYDHNRNKKIINLSNKNDLILYESATIIHGRPIPYKGNSYANIFIHYQTKDWNKKVMKPLKKVSYLRDLD